MSDEELFLKHINDNYDKLKAKYRKFCQEKDYEFDEDVYSNTIISCYDAIQKKGGLNDNSSKGIEDYFFKSFKQNTQREKQYCRVAKRDFNVEDVNGKYEEWYNNNFTSEKNKLMSDLYNDYATLYILNKVDEAFPSDESYLFRIKYLLNLTYKQLAEKTNAKKARQKVINVKNWVKENIKQDDIKKSFQYNFNEFF